MANTINISGSKPKIIVGLGNPGSNYSMTRHNAGFLVVEGLMRELGANYVKDKCGAQVAEVTYTPAGDGPQKLVLARPQSYMNLSGGPVKKLLDEYKCTPADLLVVQDDLDIPAGELRFKESGGHAGHNGIRSIHDKLGTNEYRRLRVGIGRPPGNMPVDAYVLQQMRGDVWEEFEAEVDRAVVALLEFLRSV